MYHHCNSRSCKRCHPPSSSSYQLNEPYKFFQLQDELLNPIVYPISKKRRKSSIKISQPIEPEESTPPPQSKVEEIVVPAEKIKVVNNGEEQKEGGDLCQTCHPPTVRVVFIKKRKECHKRNDDDDLPNNLVVCTGNHANQYNYPVRTENAWKNADKVESTHSYKSRYSVITACVKQNKPHRTPCDLGHYHGQCDSSSTDSDDEGQCACGGPMMPCPGVTNRTRYCQCSSGRDKPVYCDECAESEGLVPGYAQQSVVYCDCIDFESPKYYGKNLVFPHGRGHGGLCKQCAEEDTEEQQDWPVMMDSTPLGKKVRTKKGKRKGRSGSTDSDPNSVVGKGEGRPRSRKRSTSKGKKKGKKSKKKSKGKKKRGGDKDKSKHDKDDGCCRRGLLRFVSRSSDSSG